MPILSFDDFNDVINSLSIAYNCNKECILKIFNEDWPDFFYTQEASYEEIFNEEYTPYIMEHKLNSSINTNIKHACFYHRSVYDGSKDWFKEGILNSVEGAELFLEKIKNIINIENFDSIKEISIANIKERNSFEGRTSGGPYAFDCLEDAAKADQPGLDYSTPEFFIGNIWESKSNPYCFEKSTIDAIKSNLSFVPVVVKFKSTSFSIMKYINNLWYYLFRLHLKDHMSTSSHYPCSFIGKGQKIPPNDILKIIRIENEISN